MGDCGLSVTSNETEAVEFSTSHSDESISCNNEIEKEPPTKKRIHQKFNHAETFDDLDDAKHHIANLRIWSPYFTSKSNDGERIKYRCNKVKFRAKKQCAASLYLLCDSRSSKVQLFVSVDEHDHDENVDSVYEIAEETKDAIRDMFEMGITKPKQIKNNLLMKKFEPPDSQKFDSFLKTLRAERDGSAKISLGDLKKWLEDNSLVPVEKTKPFVIHFEISFDEKNPHFRFFVSSKVLLSSAIDATKVHTDATYKLTWQGYPVFQIGTTDMHRSFHPFGIAVCTNEQTDDFR